ncbi:hypothetical protein QAD02_002251 [Eretmocerus hayati]|uniref:Uncharacterized protein n=1 Tax=Eretmocerus hayati TaxID=131215 RepID=A0ACC2NL94_9HYME|nr:hypothetical protein QAD02_002251 [Eretmocerus hayati]
MCGAPSALLLYGMSERYRGSINPKDVGSHSSCSLVSAILWDSPARIATSDDDRPVKDRNASSDLEQHNSKRSKSRRETSYIAHWSLANDNMIESHSHGQRVGQFNSTMSRAPRDSLVHGRSRRCRGFINPRNLNGHT